MASPAQAEFLHRARELHRRAIVVDAHADTPQRMLDEGFDLGIRAADGHLDLPRMRDAALGAQFMAIWVQPRHAPNFLRRALDLIGAVSRELERHRDQLELAIGPHDVGRIHAAGRIAILMGAEGGHILEDDPQNLDRLYGLGIRYLTLTWTNSNSWAGSSGDEGRERGLSPLGREIIERMNRLGMMVDVSHVSDRTFYDVLETSRAPVFASHSCCRALCDHGRNLTDQMIRDLAARDGVLAVNFYSGFVDQAYADAWHALKPQFFAGYREVETRWRNDARRLAEETRRLEEEYDERLPRPGLERVADHIEHAVALVGADHVALGSDFDGARMPRGLDDVSFLPHLTAELMRRGFDERDLAAILGSNLLILMERVEGLRQTE